MSSSERDVTRETTQAHTPGPWKCSGVGAILGPSGEYIASCQPLLALQGNARLIEAAPELLAFVQEWLKDWTAAGPTDSPLEAEARALIAKCSGVSQAEAPAK